MKNSVLSRVVCVCLVVLVFLSSSGVSFIKHHCSATHVTKLFVNEIHDCSVNAEHNDLEASCDTDGGCSCSGRAVDSDTLSIKCEKCCKDSMKVFALDIPINVVSIGTTIKALCVDIVLFFDSVFCSVVNFLVDFIKEIPPLINIFDTSTLLHFISVLRI